MDLKDAAKRVERRHIDEAIRQIQSHDQDGFEWLYERTGRREPDSRYIVFDDTRFPTKALGFLAAQIAGGTDQKSSNMTVDQAAAPLARHGGVEVRRGGKAMDSRQEESREASYYRSLARPEQARFRALLTAAYGKCAVSGVSTPQALQAAHVIEFARRGRNALANGILLRCDLHSLFDAGEMGIDPTTMKVHFSAASRRDYAQLQGQAITIPAGGPSPSAFQERWESFREYRQT